MNREKSEVNTVSQYNVPSKTRKLIYRKTKNLIININIVGTNQTLNHIWQHIRLGKKVYIIVTKLKFKSISGHSYVTSKLRLSDPRIRTPYQEVPSDSEMGNKQNRTLGYETSFSIGKSLFPDL